MNHIEEDDDIQEYKKPWVGLTENERSALYDKHSLDSPSILIKAIETKLKEKNA
jgi:hypothetical protein